jgi:hypothetical protein
MCSVKSRSNRTTFPVDVIFGTLCMWPAPDGGYISCPTRAPPNGKCRSAAVSNGLERCLRNGL